MPWTTADIPSQDGRTAIVTGSNTGLGLETAAALAGNGARVVLACRNLDKASAARDEILGRGATGEVELLGLDLSDLHQIADAGAEALDRFDQIDLLINNAGVMIPPLERTAQGFELQFGTNHLGHFAFTGHLIERIVKASESRVVTVSSIAHRAGTIRWDDLNWSRRYNRVRAYGQSKLANLLFTFELERRLRAADAPTVALAAHPGTSTTELVRHVPGANLPGVSKVVSLGTKVIGQPAAMGALPSLRAATDPDATGGQYYGPDGFQEMSGHPVLVEPRRFATRPEHWTRLWDASVELTGVEYPI